MQKVRERQMGYWFENMEKMDIQEERRNTAKARQETEQARQETEQARQEMKQARKEMKQARHEAEQAHENAIKSVITVCQELGAGKETAVEKVMQNCLLDENTAVEKVELYWKNK